MMLGPSGMAQDGITPVGIGGLVVDKLYPIQLDRENVHITGKEVIVDSQFHNISSEDMTRVVTLPIAPVGPELYAGYFLNLFNYQDNSSFDPVITVDGKPIVAKLEVRATAGFLDVTERLKALNVNLLPGLAQRALFGLTAKQKQELEELGVVVGGVDNPYPNWTVRLTYYWVQSFPGNKTLSIRHVYSLGLGEWRFDPEMRYSYGYSRILCIDDALRQYLRQAEKEGRHWESVRQIVYSVPQIPGQRERVGEFRIAVDKRDPDAAVSICSEGIVTSLPAGSAMIKQQFDSAAEIRVVIFEPRQMH